MKPDHWDRYVCCLCRSAVVLAAWLWQVGSSPLTCLAVQPTTEEISLRDVWVDDHFPTGTPGMCTDAVPQMATRPALFVWHSYDQVFRNDVPGKGLRIAERSFAHGIYCHAPTRMEVRLPAAAKSFSSTVGILTNPASQGGSIVFTVTVGEKTVYASPVMHRGETGVQATAELDGAQSFFLSVGDADDGISSDQGVWGAAIVTLLDGSELRLSDLPLRDALVCERSNATLPFSFLYDGQTSDTLLPTWTFEEEKDTSDPKKTKRVRSFTDPKTGLRVRNTVIEYTDYPTVEWTLDFENTGNKDTPIISGIQSLDTSFVQPTDGPLTLHSIKGDSCTPDSYQPFAESMPAGYSKRMASQGGRPTNGSFPYWNIATEDGGFLAVLGWPGQWSAQFERDVDQALHIRAGQELTRFRLQPGEEVRSPLSVLQFYQGDWIRGQNLWRRWMVAHNLPRPGGKLVPTHYAACFGTDLVPTAADELAVIAGFQREDIQLDYWILDSGWFSGRGNWFENTGSWEVDTQRFPRGIREVSERSHANGMDFVLWFEPERAWSGTWLALHHPEWILGGAGGGLVNLGNREAWNWIVERIDSLINSEGVDVYRQDFNIDPLGFWRGADTEDRQGISEIAHVDGYLTFWKELLRRHPKLWIDSCASGGRRNDLETMRLAVPLLRSDYFSEPESQQCQTYGLSLWLPYYGSGLGTSGTYWFRSCIFPASRVGWDTRKTDLDYPLLKRMLAEYRQVQPFLLSDYYPLTPYSLDKHDWIAWQFDDPEQGGGMVQAFRRANCPDPSITLKLRGLEPKASYLVNDMDSGDSRETLGQELLETGLQVTAADPQTALLFTYQRQP